LFETDHFGVAAVDLDKIRTSFLGFSAKPNTRREIDCRLHDTMESERMWGVTPPISVSFPTESEKKLNEALFQELRRQGTFESAAETQKR
jgi:hypothetical protein